MQSNKLSKKARMKIGGVGGGVEKSETDKLIDTASLFRIAAQLRAREADHTCFDEH